MTSGAIPKSPTELKLTGTFRKDRHGKRTEPKLTRRRPARPKWLTDREAIAFWKRVVPGLTRAGLCYAEDAETLATLARWWADWQQAQRVLRRVAHANDVDTWNKASLIAARAWNQCDGIMRRFGLTPGDRAAMRLEKSEEAPADEIKFFEGGAS